MRDAIEAVHLFLEEIRTVSAVVELARTGRLTAGGWNEQVPGGKAAFHKRGLPHKLTHIKEKYQVGFDAALEQNVLSLNSARNCLVHRAGIVSLEHDANDALGLRVSWRKVELVASGPAGERPISDSDRIVEAGEMVGIRFPNTAKIFKPGESVAFTAQEFSEMCLTLITFGQDAAQKLEAHARISGFPIQPAPSPSQSA